MKIHYPMVAAVSIDQRHAQMGEAVRVANARGIRRVTPGTVPVADSLSIACYGPSLQETWRSLTPPILSMSGATHWLAARGIVPDYHIDMDPRPHKAQHLDPLVPGVQYLMASVCPPQTWDRLKDVEYRLWHVFSGTDARGRDTYRWVREHDPGARVVRGHSTIGLTALDLAYDLGFRRFEIHGMDGSFKEGHRHSGVHYGKVFPPDYTWDAEGRTYHTTQIMSNAVAETINTVTHYPYACIFHGDGLTQALVREANVPNACTAEQTEKVEAIRGGASSFWERCLDHVAPSDVVELIGYKKSAEGLRRLAKYDTGSVSLETATLLRGACKMLKPDLAVEVGTFIGFSTYALQAGALWTCDKSNNCLRADPERRIVVNPYTTARDMIARLREKTIQGARVVFLDGRLEPDEAKALVGISNEITVFLLDDCSEKSGHDKGLANLALLRPHYPDHVYIPPHQPFAGRSTLGALVPK